MNRRGFLGFLVGLPLIVRSAFGARHNTATAQQRCACCDVAIEADAKAHKNYSMALARMRKHGGEIDWAQITTFCVLCWPHRGVLSVSRQRNRITALILQAELTKQEMTPDEDGYFVVLPHKYTIYVDPAIEADVRPMLMERAAYVEEAALRDMNSFEINTEAVWHFKNREWALVPRR